MCFKIKPNTQLAITMKHGNIFKVRFPIRKLSTVLEFVTVYNNPNYNYAVS